VVIFPKVDSDSEFSQQKVSSALKKSHKFCLKVAAVILRTTEKVLAKCGQKVLKMNNLNQAKQKTFSFFKLTKKLENEKFFCSKK
jgi:hypothetical protein